MPIFFGGLGMHAVFDMPTSVTALARRAFPSPNRQRKALAARILRLLRSYGAGPGYRVSVAGLCRELRSSASTVRAALNNLGAQGAVEWRNSRGFVLARPIAGSIRVQVENCHHRWMRSIFQVRKAGALADVCSSNDVARAVGIRKTAATDVMLAMERLELLERLSGSLWRFCEKGSDAQVLSESYNLRLAIEPQSLLAAARGNDGLWLIQARERHMRVLCGERPADLTALCQLDAEFHQQLVCLSGNRFMIETTGQQIAIADLISNRSTDDLRHDLEEHLAIIAALAAGKRTRASEMLAHHLARAMHSERVMAVTA